MRQARYWIFLLPLFFVLACVGVYAQANSDVTGIITDQTGAVVAGANISVTDPATGATHSTISDGTGLYDIAGLNPANYDLKVTANGFKTYEQSGVVVNVSATFRVDVKLAIGTESQTVTVMADALTVQTDSNVISTLISGQQITELATNGRNIVSLAQLGMGVSSNNPDMNLPSTTGAAYSISFNGLQPGHNIWIIDGGEAYDRGSGGKMALMPSQDALSEFQVLASNYPPDYGIASGGTITMSIKSGTSKLHGSGWEFDRNDAFQAHNWFDNNHGQESKKSELRYNVYGFNVGGPVIIPHVYNRGSKQKTFFFYNEEWRKQIVGQGTAQYNGVPVADAPTTATATTWVLPAYGTAAQLAEPVGHQIFAPQVSTATPIGAKLLGDGFTATGGVINAGQPFAGNIVPANLFDPNALIFNATKNIPTVANDSTTGKWSPGPGHLPTPIRDDIARIDHNFNDKWSVLGHFIHDESVVSYNTVLWNADNIPTVGSSFSNPSYGAVIKLTGALTPGILLEAAFNYDGNKINLLPVPALGGSIVQPSGWGSGASLSYFPAANNAGKRLPDISLSTTGVNWGPGNEPWLNGAEDYNEIFALSVTKGKHAMKFGGGYNRYTKNQVIGNDTEGNYSFNDGWNATAGTPSGALTGDSYLDFDLGLATNYNQSETDPENNYVNNTISAYAMDNWHANNRLSVQLGLRYDALPHVWERHNQLSNFDPSQYQTALAPIFNTSSAAFCTATGSGCSGVSPGLQTVGGATYYLNGVMLAGVNGTPRGMVKNWWKTYEPRVGFSYDVTGTGRTVVRGGFGTFFERIQGNDIYDIAGNAPFVNTPSANDVELSNTSTNWLSGGTASSPIFPQGPTVMNPYYPDPAVAMFSLGVQHEIVPSVVWAVQYVGNIDWHQNIRVNINTFPLSTSMANRELYASGSMSSYQDQNTVTYPGFGGMNQITNVATGSYNSLQTGVRQQGKHGLSYEVDYTWSHEIDSELGSGDLNYCASDPWNIKYDKGSGTLDHRQMLSANYEYKLPFFLNSSGLERSILGGWEIAGTVIKETGLPWSGNNAPTGNYPDTVGLGGGYSNRASVIPGQKVTYSKKQLSPGNYYWMNPANATTTFEAPIAAWAGGANLGFGNSGRDIVVGPGRTNFNTSIYKSFALGEEARFEFRAESYNTFNHTQFDVGSGAGNINDNTNSAQFGLVGNAADPRTFQFGGKILF
jgi:hypothetical protein